MQLEQYFDFVGDNAIRVAGTRVGIETIVRDYNSGASPEEIVLRYPTLTLEQVHATITYYLSHTAEVHAYLTRVEEHGEAAWRDQQRQPSEFVQLLRERMDRQRATREQAAGDPAAVSGG